ncbi:MAG: hypothetical protein HYT40_00050 [Candidatus Sungbacteria bacterium]|uniref:UDP-N-acetylglucosamine 2-epimerase domain-containing protein n=1 Tax=Candidatus Sungiibacteriota bacterium TaxID=2750080 RepID=A0A931SCH9_9BACT|nr:hypothetical protein [Candidatus Sungbacteria bacterium]
MKNTSQENVSLILITVSEGSIARNILRSFVLDGLLQRSEAKIILLVLPEKVELYTKEFTSSRVKVISVVLSSHSFFQRVLQYLARNGLRTETVMTDQKTYHLRHGRSFAWVIKLIINRLLGTSKIFHALIRGLAKMRTPAPAIRKILLNQKPDLVFATDVQDELDIEVMLASYHMKIPLVGMVRSWDNLTSGAGLIQFVPEKLLIWNPFMHTQAVTVQHVEDERLIMAGIPHFDWYMHKDLLVSREEFFGSLGLDPKKKTILFAGIGSYLAPHEVEVAECISDAFEAGKLPEDAQMIFRPHPNFTVDRDRVLSFARTVFDDGVAFYTADSPGSWEMDKSKIAHLMNSIYHADVVITTASTITIDAVAFGKPVICIGFDGKSQEPYWDSVKRYYDGYTHYIAITKTKGFQLVFSADELIAAIQLYLKNPEADAEGRKKIFDEFIWKLGGSAERLIKAVLD